jgi:hypothetical protein
MTANMARRHHTHMGVTVAHTREQLARRRRRRRRESIRRRVAFGVIAYAIIAIIWCAEGWPDLQTIIYRVTN